jgi:ribonuclease HII
MLIAKNLPQYSHYENIAGVDEAGRGPLAGPVVVAAVILNSEIIGLNDSKKLSEKKRTLLFDEIIQKAKSYKIEIVPPKIIDEMNILQATLWGMEEAVLHLPVSANFSLIDGNKIPKRLIKNAEAIVKGDGKFASIAAASILAKVTRDRIMIKLHNEYPQYNFLSNKGYPTKEHMAAIRKYGITIHHRRSYKPVQQYSFDF